MTLLMQFTFMVTDSKWSGYALFNAHQAPDFYAKICIPDRQENLGDLSSLGLSTIA